MISTSRLISVFRGAFVVMCTLLSVASLSAQTKPAQEQEDVIRVNTELVQTDVMVFDKQGRFVDGLKPEQFSLKINNKPTPISFFERVTAGKVELNRVEAKENSNSPSAKPGSTTNVVSIIRGRTVIFFVD